MTEPNDVILPILRNIEDRLSTFEKRTDAGLSAMREALLDQKEKLEQMQGLTTYHLGMTTDQSHQVQVIQAQLKELRRRVETLESGR